MTVPVVPKLAGDLAQFMKEKTKVDTTKMILSPMPGVVKSVAVEVGQQIGEGMGKKMFEKLLNSIQMRF